MIDEKASQAVYPNQFYVHENKAKEEWRKETLAKVDSHLIVNNTK